MSTAYPTNILFQILINSTWLDISSDVVGEQSCVYGIQGSGPTDRVASTGTFKFRLRNDKGCLGGVAGYYSPGHAKQLAGWSTGLPFRVLIAYDGEIFCKFRGKVASILPQSGLSPQQVEVSAVDWFDLANKYPVAVAVGYDQRIDQAAATLVTLMPSAPQHQMYGTGADTFTTVFDDVKSTTRIATEFGKLALSELGYIYLRRDKADGETLVVEGRHRRNADGELTPIPQSAALSGRLLAEDGGYLLLEDGGRIVLNEATTVNFDNRAMDMDVVHGALLANAVKIKSYPRRMDTATAVLYSISEPISLASGETKTFRAAYRDPNGLAKSVNGRSMIAPAATTDYLLNTAKNGSGTNVTASLTVNAVYDSSGIDYSLSNGSAATGYVTHLQARGLGIYIYEPVEIVTQDSASILAYEYSELTIDQKYQNDVYASASVGQVMLEQYKMPRSQARTVSFQANAADDLMQAFLYHDIGDLIHLAESQSGIDAYYYIQAVEYQLKAAGIITYTWTLAEALSLREVYWELGTAGRGELDSTTILGY
ncbi:MAG TPA: hypothetical protein PKD23_06675 [Bellilinea sp.]|nr:hypothetical protein [Bellilinea sp.]